MRVLVAAACAGALSLAASAVATHEPIDTEGHSTLEQRVVPVGDREQGYTNLALGAGEEYVVREESAQAQAGREQRRQSLAYVSQMTDFQLADEESPARVEFVDPGPSSAWRPQEGMTPFQIEATMRQINRFVPASPVAQGDGTRRPMDFGLLTGDQADNQHLNETVWVRDLLEGGGPTNFNSGLSDPGDYANPATLGASCAAFVAQEGGAAGAAAEGARYTGVQDYDDYPAGAPVTPLFYDPDQPMGPDWADWPQYGGLMDRAQQIVIDPVGLQVPFYITNGNHDVLVQGNEDANQALEDIATGCFKALGTTNDPTKQPPPPDGPDPNYLLSPLNVGMLVPPDPGRQFVSKPQIKEIYGATDEGAGDDDHGFALVDPAENEASNGSASYYAWDPAQTPGLRFISIDTNSEGGQTAETFVPGQPSTPGSSNGNLDDPQFQWLKGELQAARERDQIVVIFGHHPVRNMNTQIRDEQAAPCSGVDDDHGHDVNPGCDLDPRPSDGDSCIHNGTDAQNTICDDATHESFEELIAQFPNVAAYIPGHTHEHRLTPFERPDGTTWWEINTSAVIDYPNQSRLVELMDNRDGTLSLFNTVVDHAAPAAAPEGCADCAAAFDEPQLASIGRAFTFNDPDNDLSGAGRRIDRNAELLLEDPRPVADLAVTKADAPDPVRAGERLTYTLSVTNEGPQAAREVRLTDALPAGVTIGTYEPSQGACELEQRILACELGPLDAGQTATVTVAVVPERAGEITNTVRVGGNVSDRDGSDDTATQTTTVAPAATATGGGSATNNPPNNDGGGPRGAGTPPSCASAAGFAYVDVQPRRRRLHLAFAPRTSSPVAIDVFRTSVRRRVIHEQLVARFSGRRSSFTWNGRSNRPGRRVGDGVYFVRFRIARAGGGRDVRRLTLRRARGRWSRRPAFHRGASCGLVPTFKLRRPVFGGRGSRPLVISYRLAAVARVRVEIRRRGRVVKRYRAALRGPGVSHRLRFSARGRRRGDYRVRLVAEGARGRVVRTLVSRRL